MCNIQRTSCFQSFFLFFLPQDLERQHKLFLETDLGKAYQAIPWKKLIEAFKLANKSKGPTSIFPLQGKIALMFLKAYSQVSDKRLIEQLYGYLPV